MAALVRPARPDDWPQLWPMLEAMGTPERAESSYARFLRLVGEPSWLVVVVQDDGSLRGYAAAQDHGEHLRTGAAGRVARLHDMYVDPASRRAGVGRALMDAVVAWAAPRVRYLQWQAHEHRSAPFYERLGYRGDPCPQPDYPEFEVTFGPVAQG